MSPSAALVSAPADQAAKLSPASAAAVRKDAAAFVTLIADLKEKLAELRLRLGPTVDSAKAGDMQTAKGVSLLEVKVHSMLSYLTNLAFYLLLKLHGKAVSGHAAIDRLVELRIVMEKTKPLEQKLKYQIDKLVKAASMADDQSAATGANGASLAVERETGLSADALSFKPNPAAMLADSAAGVGDSNARGGGGGDEDNATGGVYRPPKLAPMPYDEGRRAKTGRLTEQAKLKASRSRLLRDLRSQYDDRPEEMTAEGTGYGAAEVGASKDDEEWAERERYEEENFTRLNMKREDKRLVKRIAKQGAGNRFANEFQALQEDFADLSSIHRAVQDEDELAYGGKKSDIVHRKNRRAADIARGEESAGGKKRKFNDAADLVATAAKITRTRGGYGGGDDGGDGFATQVAKRKKALAKLSKGKGKGKAKAAAK
ncbi:Serine/threonine-protein kinase smg1 [Geranomyces variabilis]|uniref:Serine/threonine-protein kinase smg1 n=1 Tax=Geranomyces variabilis TaxID=109894 RepID=A0AAD5TMG4_9FUNG|nr:Serine/threonine-protein kinase smg1 [Geranomyces variabilis]